MDIAWWQVLLLTLYSAFAIYDGNNTTMGFVKPTMAGFFAGLILGDIETGLIVGGTLNLLVLGVGNFGGASIPDYMTGALIGTAFAIFSGEGAQFGISLAIPIGLLMVQLDVLARFTNTYFQNRAERFIKQGDIDRASRMGLWGIMPTSLSRMIPVALALIFGSQFVESIVGYMPDWLMSGLEVAGGMLPALGIAILLRYLPVNENIPYLIIGFVVAAYLDITVLGAALIGLALAILGYQRLTKNNDDSNDPNNATVANGGMGDE